MKKTVSLKIPLGSGNFPVVKLPGPCIYCDQPVNPDGFTWVDTQSFPLMKWGVSNKFGDHQIYPVKVNGVPKMGTVRIEAPYCERHKQVVTVYKWVRFAIILLGLIAGIVILALTWSNVSTQSWLDFVSIIMFPTFGAFAGFLVSILAIRILYLFMGAKKDYPTFLKGHWGLAIDGTTNEKGETGVGPIRYFLVLDFLNPEAARRTYEAYPGTGILRGEKLLIHTEVD